MLISLRAARVNANLTQADAAIAIGVSKDTIRNWETGKTFPDSKQIIAIENTYGVKYDDIKFLT